MKSVWIGQIFVFNPKNSKGKDYVGVYDVLVSLHSGTTCLNMAASLVQLWVQACCSSSAISSEDQVC